MSRLRTPLFVLLLVVPSPAPAQPPRTNDPALPEGAMARIGSLRFWHRGAVRSLAFLPDGRTLASLGANNDFHLWDSASGAEKHQLEKQVALRRPDPNFGMLVVGGPGGQMVLQSGGQQTATFSPDGKLLAAGDSSGIRVWDTASGRQLRRLPIKEAGIFSIAFSADSKRLAVAAGEPVVVHVWEVGGKEVWQLRSPGNRWPVQQLAFAPNGAYLVAASAHELRVWDLARGKRVRVYQGHENTVTALAISPDSKRVASASEDNTVRLWEDSSEEEVAKLVTPQGAVKALTFAPDGKTLATAGNDHSLGLWDGTSLKQIKDLGGAGGAATALAFTLDGKTLAVGGADGIIRLWDVAKGAQRIVKDVVALVSVAYVERGSRIALGGADGTVRYCDPGTGNVVRRFGPPEGKGIAVEFAAGCRVAAVMSKEEAVVFHDLVKGKELFRIKGEEAPTTLTLSPDGRLLAGAFGEAKQPRMLDAATGKVLRSFGEPGSASLIAFAPGGRALVTIGDESLIRLWEVLTGKERWRFRGPPGTTRCVAFAPGGRLLATGGEDETVRVWDVLTGKMKRGLVGPGGAVTALVFSPDGKRLASGSEDGTVRIWEVASGEEQRHFEGHRGRVVALDFSPDGRHLVSGSDDTTAIVWDPERPGRAVRPQDRERRLETLWADLESDDASVAFAAHAALTEVPREAVLFLRHRLRPVSPADPALVVRLIADLGHRRFAAREQAMRELERLEGQAEQPLRRVLEAKPSVEVEKRLKILLGRLEAGPSSGPELRAVRAVELLEQLNTGESRLLLGELSHGAVGARLTEEARAALRRLAKRANADSE